jgi:hypothetical protein
MGEANDGSIISLIFRRRHAVSKDSPRALSRTLEAGSADSRANEISEHWASLVLEEYSGGRYSSMYVPTIKRNSVTRP